MILGFGNNVVSSLASDITAGQTSIPVFPGDGPLFAALLTSDFSNNSTELKNYAKITLTDSGETAFEICHLLTVSGDTLTVVRGQEGTAAKGWSLKDVVANFATRGSENSFVQIEQLQSGQYISGVAGGTANALTLDLPATYFINGGTDWTLHTPIVVYPSQNNTGACTLQLTMGGRFLGVFPLYKGDKTELVARDTQKDVGLICLLDNTKTFFTVLNPAGIYSSFVPINRKVNGHELSRDINVTSQDIFDGQAAYLGEQADLNNCTTPGLYYQPANTGAIAGKNYPEPNAGSLEVYKHAGITQIYRIYNTSRSYVRTMYAGGWSAWVMQYDKENRPTAAEVGAISASGGAYTGDLGMSKFYTHAVEGGNATYLYTPPGPYPAYSMVSCNAYNWYDTQVLAGLIRGTDQNTLGWGVMVNGSRIFHANPQGHAVASGAFFESGGNVRVYSPNNPPPKQDLSGYATSQWVLDNFAQKSTVGLAQTGWHRDWSTGLITQWGFTNNASGLQTINFPIAFPNACFSVLSTPYTAGVIGTVTSVVMSLNNSSATFNVNQAIPVFWEAKGY